MTTPQITQPTSSVDLTNPGPIGGTTPGSGAFTTLSATGQFTSTVTTGTAPFVVASTTVVANLNAAKLGGATFAAPGAIGGTTPAAGTFTGLTATSSFTLTGLGTAQSTTGTSPGWYAQLTGDSVPRVRVGLNASDMASIAFGSGSGTHDLFLERLGAASLRLGTVDAAAPVAQTISVQGVVAGTSNTAGVALTIKGSRGTGTGAGGSLIFQVAPAGSTGTAQNALATALTIDSTKAATFAVGVTAGGFTATGAISTDTLLNIRHVGPAGVIFDATADGVVIIQNWAQSAYGTLWVKNLQTVPSTVAALTAAATAGAGARAFVTDASTTVVLGLGLTVTGGGANKVPVYSDGTNWIIG